MIRVTEIFRHQTHLKELMLIRFLRLTRCIPLNTVTKEEKYAHALICQVFENCLITQVDLVVAPCNGIPDILGF